MIRRYKYTFITLFLALGFMVCSMAGMNFIIKIREKQLLTEAGEAEIESPVCAWNEWENNIQNELQGNYNNDRCLLSNIQIENAIKSWNERIGETMHNPVEGQISMEDAIKMGEEWLIKMNMGEKESGNSDANFTKATLSVGIQSQSDEQLLEPYYSFWTVNFSSQTMNAVLYLNAVTGKVWGAEISLYGSMHEEPYDNLKLFAELAGLEVSEKESVQLGDSKTEATLVVNGGRLYVKQQCYSMGFNSEVLDIQEKNQTGKNYGNAIIRYQIMAL